MAEQTAALERLLEIAKRDTGQSRRVASFLLAWWNAEECGGFDLTDFWNVDAEIVRDMISVLELVVAQRKYPDTFGYGKDFEYLVKLWRPALKENYTETGFELYSEGQMAYAKGEPFDASHPRPWRLGWQDGADQVKRVVDAGSH